MNSFLEQNICFEIIFLHQHDNCHHKPFLEIVMQILICNLNNTNLIETCKLEKDNLEQT